MKNEPLHVRSWRNHVHDVVEIGFDSDGDFIVLDSSGYSIIVHNSEVQRLRDWFANLSPVEPTP